MRILITGVAGFIGYYLAERMLNEGYEVVGIDNINDYYDIKLKYNRLHKLGIEQEDINYGESIQSEKYKRFYFVRMNIEDRSLLANLFLNKKFDVVCNLAAQAGVRYSIDNPFSYIDSNIAGFMNVLECCRHNQIKHLVYASSSSVYGMNEKVPFSENDAVDKPASLYAVTKRANELMAYTYTNLYNLPTTGFRFFTVYGPLGRPDMAPMIFTQAILQGKPIKVYNNGNLSRDFTYIDDIIEGVGRVIKGNVSTRKSRDSKIYNIGNSRPIQLLDFIKCIEDNIGEKAIKEMQPMQKGDVYQTYADVSSLEKDFGYSPSTSLEVGIKKLVDWYIDFYKR